MNKIYILHNPNSGNGFGEYNANLIKQRLLELGVEKVVIFKSPSEDALDEIMQNLHMANEECDAFVVMGGDGTAGLFVTKMLAHNLHYNIAIFPQGTANDFAKYHKISKDINEFCEALLAGRFVESDIAFVNRRHIAINVVNGGVFASKNMQFKRRAKKFFGLIAYYAKSAYKVLFHMKSQRLSIKVDGEEFREDVYLYFILNTPGAGGLHKICKQANINDGKFDFFAIKKCNKLVLPLLFIRILLGHGKKSKYVIYKQGKQFQVKCIDGLNTSFEYSDLDGNAGPALPLNVQVAKGKINVLTNNSKLY